MKPATRKNILEKSFRKLTEAPRQNRRIFKAGFHLACEQARKIGEPGERSPTWEPVHRLVFTRTYKQKQKQKLKRCLSK